MESFIHLSQKWIVLFIFLNMITCFGKSQDLQIIPSAVLFDCEAGHTNDALTLLDEYNDYADLPEYNLGYHNNPVAYIMNQSIRKIEVSFKDDNTNEYNGVAHLILKLSKSSGDYSIGEVCNLFIPNYDFGNSSESSVVSLTGAFPESVGKHIYQWKWEIYAIPVNAPSRCAGWNTSYTSHTFYTVLDEPKSPMTNPWIEILDLSCVWANAQTDSVNTAQKVAEGIYNMGDTDGDIDYDEFSYYTSISNVRQFNLTGFLNNIKNSSSVRVNCDDIANFFNICTLALGLNSESKRILKQIQPAFITNQIDPIGLGNTLYTPAWSKHHCGWFNGMVFEPCLKIGTTLPTNMAQETYESALITSSFLPPYHYYNYDVGGVTFF